MATFTKENGPLPDLSEEEQRLALEFYARRKQQLEARASEPQSQPTSQTPVSVPTPVIAGALGEINTNVPEGSGRLSDYRPLKATWDLLLTAAPQLIRKTFLPCLPKHISDPRKTQRGCQCATTGCTQLTWRKHVK